MIHRIEEYVHSDQHNMSDSIIFSAESNQNTLRCMLITPFLGRVDNVSRTHIRSCTACCDLYLNAYENVSSMAHFRPIALQPSMQSVRKLKMKRCLLPLQEIHQILQISLKANPDLRKILSQYEATQAAHRTQWMQSVC